METPTPDPLRSAAYAFEDEYRRLRDKKARIAMCREALAKIPDEAASEVADHILCAYVCLLLADAQYQPSFPKRVEPLYEQALRRAELSGHDSTHWMVLWRYGVHLSWDFPEQATPLIQKALKYARAPHEVEILLRSLADIYSLDEATVPQALFLYDWACLIENMPIETMRDKYRCLLRHGYEEDVRAEASRPLGDTCEDIASVLAAREALWQKDRRYSQKAIHLAAEKGLEIAEQTASRPWQVQFKLALGLIKPPVKPVNPDPESA
jgi:hypothetical protein